MYVASSIKDLLTKAHELEDTDLASASNLYLQALKEDPLNQTAYNRFNGFILKTKRL
jgi:hypothetical protein